MLCRHIIVTFTIAGSKIPKWDCILKCCAGFPGMNGPYLESPKKLDCLLMLPFIKLNYVYFKTYLNVKFVD